MFNVDNNLLNEFSDMIRKNYIQHTAKKFQTEYPERYACIGEENVVCFIEKALDKADRYNMRAEREVNGLMLLMYHWGCDFDIDLQYSWARFSIFPDTTPDDPAPPSWEALQKTYDRFLLLHKKLCGEDTIHFKRALERVCQLDFRNMASQQNDTEILEKLYALFPEKFQLCLATPEAQRGLLFQARDKTMQRTMHQTFGRHLFSYLIFFCGIGVDTDPLLAPLHPYINCEFPPGGYKEEALLYKLQNICRERLTALNTGN